MNADPAGPLAGLSWGTIFGALGAVAAPVGLAIAWVFNQGRSGSQSTIDGQARLIDDQAAQISQQAERIDRLEQRLDAQSDSLSLMRNRVQILESQLRAAGITPAL